MEWFYIIVIIIIIFFYRFFNNQLKFKKNFILLKVSWPIKSANSFSVSNILQTADCGKKQ